MQQQLSELAQQVVHVILVCNEEKDILEEEFNSLKNGMIIMESLLQSEKDRIDSKVSGVGSMMQFQNTMLQEIRSVIHILKGQDNQIVNEAMDMFTGIHREQEAMSQRISDNSLQFLAVEMSNQAIQKTLAAITLEIDEVNKAMVAITTSLQSMPTKRELRQHWSLMEDQLAQPEDITTGLTTGMKAYKVSESTPFHVEPTAGPSGTQNWMHPQRMAPMDQLSAAVSRIRDTESEISWRCQLRGGAGSNGGQGGGAAGGQGSGAAGGQDGGAAGGQDGGAAGGLGGNGDPPPDPLDHGDAGGRRMSRRKRRITELEFAKQIKIRQPKRFQGTPADDFDMWWVLVQVNIEDQREKFCKDERTID